ncbi:hypothetical protein GYA13_01300 [Candidatus Kuenenbacteria bacterium]|nr:hypothetical protein [Candidatus Kuenenbacteria bacterium]
MSKSVEAFQNKNQERIKNHELYFLSHHPLIPYSGKRENNFLPKQKIPSWGFLIFVFAFLSSVFKVLLLAIHHF